MAEKLNPNMYFSERKTIFFFSTKHIFSVLTQVVLRFSLVQQRLTSAFGFREQLQNFVSIEISLKLKNKNSYLTKTNIKLAHQGPVFWLPHGTVFELPIWWGIKTRLQDRHFVEFLRSVLCSNLQGRLEKLNHQVVLIIKTWKTGFLQDRA